MPNSTIITPPGRWIPFTIYDQPAPVWTPAWRQLPRPLTVGRTSLRLRPHLWLLLPRLGRRSCRFSLGPARLPELALTLSRLLRPPCPKPRLLVPVSVPAKHPQLLQQRPTRQPKGLSPRRQQPNCQPLRLRQAARLCCPGRATSGRTTMGKPSSQSPRRQRARGHKESWSETAFPIPEFGGGLHRKRYVIEFKLKVIGYAPSVVEGGRRPGGTVGWTYDTGALEILDKAALASWIKNRSTYEKEARAATAASETKASHVIAHPLLTHPLVITPPAFWPGSVHTHSIAIIDTPSSYPLIGTPPGSGSPYQPIMTLAFLVVTPPRYHIPELRGSRAWWLSTRMR